MVKIYINITTSIFFLFAFTNNVDNEKIECAEIKFSQEKNLLKALDYYIDFVKDKNVIILVDYMSVDSIDVFRLNGSIVLYEMFFKKPDCFFNYRNNVVYLFTENFISIKDTVWFNNVLLGTLNYFGYSIQPIIDWENDSIIYLPSLFLGIYNYDPFIIEYSVYNGEIIEMKHCSEMLYPKTGKPKGILLLEDLINPEMIEIQEWKKPSIMDKYLKK